MPIRVQNDLPVREILERENIFVMDEHRAMHQDIRPISIAILNLMPLKEDTELQILRSLSNTPIQVDVTFLKTSSHESTHTSMSHLNKFYQTFDEVKNKGVTGIAFGSIAGGGNANTIEVFGLTKEANQKIYNMILECNPRLEDSDVRIFKSSMPLNPFKWFKEREKIILTDWGFIHKQHKVVIDGKKFLSRTSVIPFESIKTYIHEGRFNKRIEILGNTTLSTQESFSRSAQKEIWRKLKEKGVSNEQGIVIRPTLFNRCKQGNIVLTSSAAIWRYKKETKLLHYENIYSHDFVKKHWYSFSGDVIIRGRRIDARAGEGGDVIMELKQVGRRKGKLLVKTIEQAKLSAGRIGKDK